MSTDKSRELAERMIRLVEGCAKALTDELVDSTPKQLWSQAMRTHIQTHFENRIGPVVAETLIALAAAVKQ